MAWMLECRAMSHNYAREQLSKAVYELAAKDGTIQERLIRAVGPYLLFAPGFEDKNDPIRERLIEILRAVGGIANYEKTIRGMSASELERIVDKILAVHDDLIAGS